jgi:hypothetical protein
MIILFVFGGDSGMGGFGEMVGGVGGIFGISTISGLAGESVPTPDSSTGGFRSKISCLGCESFAKPAPTIPSHSTNAQIGVIGNW